jgi:hypothetical protein
VNDMGSLCFAFLQHSGGRRRFLFVVCCLLLQRKNSWVIPLLRTVTFSNK